jgi:carbamoyl-phosphate synthase large subunit
MPQWRHLRELKIKTIITDRKCKFMNILFCSVGRRCELLKDFRKSLGDKLKIVVTDNSPYAPALEFADVSYQVPLIHDKAYIPMILDICRKEKIDAVTTLIDPEIDILANNREAFEELGVTVLAPYLETAKLCFDKYEMSKYLTEKGINTVRTYGSFEEFKAGFDKGMISLPVFVKPRCGSGSVGARRVDTLEMLEEVTSADKSLIIQELMTGVDMDADIYVDTISHKPVAIFSKKKISTTIGGANKTISFKDEKLFEFVKNALSVFKFNGPLDMDLFYQDGKYYLSEINPRFGGAYLHAYGAGVDFPTYIYHNVSDKKENEECLGNYDEGIVMMMYDSVVIKKLKDIQDNMVQL